ncbi:HPP family protein [Thermococcus sp. 2319x1]|uniref:CBS domain-containing protein n=1 Tax=Thermococcus sp. 2319x1 TaxID=1674923 RepID=UPI000A573D39|nr:CBS domain-containing protein [Thermococcus sp. 2319x1]
MDYPFPSKPREAKNKKVSIIIGKKRHIMLQRKEELSHNIRYISKVPVKLVMDREFLTVHPEDPLTVLIGKFTSEETSAVVVDEEGKLLGFITMKDLLHFFTMPRRYSVVGLGLLKKYTLTRASKVEDIMVTKPVTIHVDDNLGHAIKLMTETGKHHLPVIDDKKKVHGLLEVKDIIRLIRIVAL